MKGGRKGCATCRVERAGMKKFETQMQEGNGRKAFRGAKKNRLIFK